ncbi:MAG: alpha/beta hydrolase, partial [Deltaproteobacteria bacterium]|nr:alpha/beta hydrolase [Deltaproteobacteria bacterium]
MKKVALIPAVFLLACMVTGCASFKLGMYDCMINADRSRSDLKTGSVDIGEQNIAYLERPGDGETIVLIHGFGANKDNWVRFVRHIPRRYRVVCFDMPGHGDNVKLGDKTYDIDYITGGFSQAADAMGLKKFHIAGNSMGGFVSMLYTSRNPDRVITMCLLDAAGLIAQTPQPSDLQRALEQGQSPLTPTSEKEFRELLDYAFYKKPFVPWPVIPVLADRAVDSSDFTQKMWRDFHTSPTDIVPMLPGISQPSLVIWGDRDRIL